MYKGSSPLPSSQLISKRSSTAKQYYPIVFSTCKSFNIFLDISIATMLSGSTISSIIAVALVFSLPAKAAPWQMMRRSTPGLSLTAQLQIADT